MKKHKSARLHLLPMFSRYRRMSESVHHEEQCSSLHDRWCFRHDVQCSSLHTERLRTGIDSAIHHTSNANLLQASVKTCCDLPKESTIPLILLLLVYSNLSPHNDTFHIHTRHFLCSKSLIPQITIKTEWKLRGNVKSQRHKLLRRP